MASIHRPKLTVAPNRLENTARVLATCGVEFTDFEANAMRLLGLRFEVRCAVVNKDLQYETIVLTYDPQWLDSHAAAGATVVFETVTSMSDMHQHVFTRDELYAEFTIENGETRDQVSGRTEVVRVDLVA